MSGAWVLGLHHGVNANDTLYCGVTNDLGNRVWAQRDLNPQAPWPGPTRPSSGARQARQKTAANEVSHSIPREEIT